MFFFSYNLIFANIKKEISKNKNDSSRIGIAAEDTEAVCFRSPSLDKGTQDIITGIDSGQTDHVLLHSQVEHILLIVLEDNG